jgi:hypothetical protein
MRCIVQKADGLRTSCHLYQEENNATLGIGYNAEGGIELLAFQENSYDCICYKMQAETGKSHPMASEALQARLKLSFPSMPQRLDNRKRQSTKSIVTNTSTVLESCTSTSTILLSKTVY